MAERRVPRAGALVLTVSALPVFALVVLAPLAAVLWEGFAQNPLRAWATWTSPHALSAIRLTLFAAAVAVPVNLVLGFAVAWSTTHFRFPGRGALVALIDLPFTVSPVVAGLMLTLLFGARGLMGPWLAEHGIAVMYAEPAIVLATLFVTVPIVARELMPAMQQRGSDEELAALTLGAGTWRIWWQITLPGVRQALSAGVVLCTARAVGEYGAVAVVSGQVRGRTNTLPLHVEALYNDYDFVGAFAAAGLLAAVGLLSLAVSGGDHVPQAMLVRTETAEEITNTHLHPSNPKADS